MSPDQLTDTMWMGVRCAWTRCRVCRHPGCRATLLPAHQVQICMAHCKKYAQHFTAEEGALAGNGADAVEGSQLTPVCSRLPCRMPDKTPASITF